MRSKKIYEVIKTTALAALLSAGAAAAEKSEAVLAGEKSSMPEFGLMDLPGLEADTADAASPYQIGVRAYLNGKDEEAISSLEAAIRLNAADERASRLLLKVYIRAINDSYDKGDKQKARSLVQKAYGRFPSNPEVKLMYSSTQEVRASARRTPAAPERAALPERSAAAPRPDRAPAPPQAEVVPSAPPATRPVTMQTGRRTAAATVPEPWAYAGGGRISVSYPGAAAAAFVSLAVLAALFYPQRSRQTALLLRMDDMRRALAEEEGKNAAIRKELDIWKGFGKQVEELELLRKTKEQVMYLELEKMKAEEERKFMAELSEKRREAERLARLELEALTARRSAPAAPVPETSPVAAPEPEPPPAPRFSPPKVPRAAAASMEDRILEMMADIAPPEREAAWERIAMQSAELYAEAPEEAVKFLRTIAGDENPLNRASIAGALAGIAAPETLDILMALYLDPSLEVRREALKRLNMLHKDTGVRIDEGYRARIAACLNVEKEKGEWVF